MSIVQVQLNFDSLNVSAQVGDTVYFTRSGSPLGGFDNADLGNTRALGVIVGILGGTITVRYDNAIVVPGPTFGDYISFAKDKRVNTSSLLGYYASVNFVNNSRGKIELFSVGSELSESSK